MSDRPPLPPPGAAPLPPPPPPPAPVSGSDGSRRIVVAVAIAVVLVLIGATVGLVVASDTSEVDDAAPTSTLDEGTGTDSDTDPDPDPDPDDEMAVAVEELSDFVAEARGRPFKDPVVVELASDEEFDRRLLEDFEEGEQDLRDLGRILRALGFVGPDVDLVRSLRDLLSIGVIGFYDPETDELVVRGDAVTAFTKMTIVHELVHAWDDQWFDLDRQELDDADDETGFGFSALVEGNARRIENEYRATLTDEERREAAREEMAFGAGVDIDPASIPLVLIDLLVAPYDFGEPFVLLLDDAGGEARIDDAFADPPRTSSAVIHPDRYLSGFEEVAVDAPPADGEVFDEGVFGELVLALLLREAVSSRAAQDAAAAWAGDWYVAWDDGDETCLRVDFASFGTEDDRDDLRAALGEWVQQQPDASLRRVDDLLRMTACA